jgi:hypothetical protein
MLGASLELCGGGAGVLRRGFCTQHQSRGVSPLAALRCARAAALEALPATPPPQRKFREHPRHLICSAGG